MPKFRNYQTNFSGGLLSEGMLGRLDLAQYENGCKQLENWWPKVTGGMRRRPGSVYLNTPANAIRLESFVFSETQVYLVVFCSDNNVLFYDNDTGALIYTLAITTITLDATVISELSIAQLADVMFCAHENFPTLMIRRTSASVFAQEAYDFEVPIGGHADSRAAPFVKYAEVGTTISVNDWIKGNAAVVTASEALFEDRHVGYRIRYRGKQMLVNSLGGAAPAATCNVTILEDLDRGAVLTMDPLVHAPADYEVDEIIVGRDSGIKAQVVETSNTSISISMIAGIFPALASEEVEGLTSGNIGAITANTNVNPLPLADWDEEAFSPTQGYPSVVEFHSQRLWFAGSSSLPAHIFGSRVAAFFNFDVGDAFPADSIQVVISGTQINLITDVVSGRHLQVFTNAGEFYAPQTDDLPLIPETFDLKQQTRYGSKRNIEPKVFDESTLFAQAQGNAVREFIWVDQLRGYSADAISLIAEEHLNNIVEVEILYGGYDRPEQLAFFVNGDGTITWYHAARAEQIRTWGKWTTQGDYKSLTVLQDKMYALVDRASGLFIERFELDVTLDCAVQVTDTAKSVWSGDHPALSGEAVQLGVSVVPANHDPDYYLGEYLYNLGSVDVSPDIVDNLTIGLGFTQTLEIMPIEVKDTNGVTGGMPKRLISADLYMASTLAIQIEGHRVTTFNAPPTDFGIAPTPITGLRKFYLLGYNERPTLTITNEIPVPCEALALGAEVEY
jgi:hypothetical protein